MLVKVVNVTGDHLFFLKCIGPPGVVATTNPNEYTANGLDTAVDVVVVERKWLYSRLP